MKKLLKRQEYSILAIKDTDLMEYIPKPLDTSNIVLTDGLEELMEFLSKNVHEAWTVGRIADGWKYGLVLDEIKKEHPCLTYERRKGL